MRYLMTSCLVFLNLGCLGKNLAADRAEKSPEQEAREYMNEGEYAKAIEILEPLVEDNPEEYFRMPLLSAAYAGLAGVSVLDLVVAKFDGGSGDSVFDQLGGFLPEDYTMDEVETVGDGVSTLELIPKAKRGAEGDPDYGESAELQLTLYRTVYSTMYLNLFVVLKNGELDLDALSEMSEEDASAILSSLLQASRDGNGGISDSVGTTLDDIDAQEGETDNEKLQNYIASQH